MATSCLFSGELWRTSCWRVSGDIWLFLVPLLGHMTVSGRHMRTSWLFVCFLAVIRRYFVYFLAYLWRHALCFLAGLWEYLAFLGAQVWA